MSLYNSLLEMVMVDEASWLDKVTLGFKIKPHQNLDETLKKHEYPGFLKVCKEAKDIEVVHYLRQDINIGLNDIKSIRDRIDKINKLGDDHPQVKNYVKGIKSKYIDKGITVKDCDLTIDWFETVCRKALNERAKELRS